MIPEAAPVTACLLHADYHAMRADCWDVTMEWFFEHQEMPPAAQRSAYQGAVERLLLDGLTEATSGEATP